MLTSVRGLVAATILAGCGLAATPVLAQDETDPPGEFTVSGDVTLASDYRFRGLSLSGGDPAIQGGISVAHSSGFYIGTWGSSIDGGDRSILLDDGTGVIQSYRNGALGSMEFNLYGGWSGEVSSGIEVDVGLLYYIYPNAVNRTATFIEPDGEGGSGFPIFDGYVDFPTDILEAYASISGTFGPAKATLGAAYAWDQASLGDDDNLYIYGDIEVGIPNSPITVAGHLGWTDGALSPKVLTGRSGSGFDYSLTGSIAMTENLTFSLGYVGVDGAVINSFSDDTVVATLTLSF